MSRAHAAEIEDVVEDSDDYDAYDVDAILARASSKRQERKTAKPRNGASWRAIEDLMETRRLKRQLHEFYDEDF